MKHPRPAFSVLCLLAIAFGSSAAAADAEPIRGEVRFEVTDAENTVGERFRLTAHTFPYELRPVSESRTIVLSDVTFPSPVETPHELNNTVHCEYYRPKVDGKRPAVIVLHILGGDFALSRVFCNMLAQRGVAALFVKMPYYGPRRDSQSPRRMISANPDETVEGMTQAVLDIRRATAWLAAREEVDPEQLGIFGISLGGLTGSLAAANEPRLKNVCLLLAGGDLGKINWESPDLQKVRRELPKFGLEKEALLKKLAPIDPVTYAANLRGRRVLMLNARDDELIPRACTESLWSACGEPEIIWYPGGHYSVIRHIFGALDRVSGFFAATKHSAK